PSFWEPPRAPQAARHACSLPAARAGGGRRGTAKRRPPGARLSQDDMTTDMQEQRGSVTALPAVAVERGSTGSMAHSGDEFYTNGEGEEGAVDVPLIAVDGVEAVGAPAGAVASSKPGKWESPRSAKERIRRRTKSRIDALKADRDQEYWHGEVEVLAPSQKWREATVVRRLQNGVQVHYEGFDSKYDEVLPFTSSRLRKYGQLRSETLSSLKASFISQYGASQCPGCGVELQSHSPMKLGYIPPHKFQPSAEEDGDGKNSDLVLTPEEEVNLLLKADGYRDGASATFPKRASQKKFRVIQNIYLNIRKASLELVVRYNQHSAHARAWAERAGRPACLATSHAILPSAESTRKRRDAIS
ncbi:unnamed protein product, partial [Prorocentrum cordatum]